MRRQLNVKFLLALMVAMAALGGGMHVLHRFQVERSASLLLKQADAAEESGELAEAQRYLSRYLGYEPNDHEALARYGLMLADRADSPRALMQAFLTVEQAVRNNPDREDVRRRVIDVAMDERLGRYSDARAHLEILLGRSQPEVSPGAPPPSIEDGELEFLFGRCFEGERNYTAAAPWYSAAIRHAPQLLDAYIRLATLLRTQLNNPDEADRVMDARETTGGLVASNPDAYRAYLERGVYRVTYRIEGGEQDVARAFEMAPDDPDVLLATAEVALNSGDFGNARRHLARAVETAPEDGRIYQALAMVELRAGQDAEGEDALREGAEEAEKSLRRGLDALADDGEQKSQLQWTLANLLIDRGKFNEANQVIDQMREARVRPELLKYLAARTLLAESKWTQAARALEEVRPLLAADRPELSYRIDLMLGHCYEQLGDHDTRLTAYQRAVNTDPLGLPARLGLAATQEALGRLDQAIDSYRLLLSQVPTAHVELVRLLIAQTLRRAEAQRDWRAVDHALADAARALPGSVEVVLLRAAVLVAKNQAEPARELIVQARATHPDRIEVWTALAQLEGRQKGPDAALAVLDEANAQFGDRVEPRLAKAQILAGQGGETAGPALATLAEALETFSPEDQSRLLRGLAGLQHQLGNAPGAEQLLDRLAQEQPDDLNLRLAQLDLALTSDDEPAMRRLLDEIEAIEKRTLGEDAMFYRYSRARYLIWRAMRGGMENLDRHQLGEARKALAEIAAKRPSWSRVWLILGEVDDTLGNPESALRSYRRAFELGERRPELVRRTAQLLASQRQFEQAGQVINQFQSEDPNLGGDVTLRRLAAELALQNGQADRAVELARQAVPAASDDPADHIWLGRLLWQAETRDEVEPALRRALELDDTNPEAWIAWVDYLALTEQTERAQASIERVRTKVPADQAPLTLAQCYAAVGQRDQAQEQFQKALAAQPDDPQVLRAAAVFTLAGGQFPEAEAHLRKILALDPRTLDPDTATWARRLLAIVLTAQGNYQLAREALTLMGLGDEALSQLSFESSTDELRAQAQVLALQRGRTPRLAAIRILEQLLQRGTAATPSDQFLLAQLHAAERSWPSYRDRMQALLANHGRNPQYLAHYVRSLLAQNDADGARVWLNRLEQVQPDAPETLELKARVLAAQDRGGEAVALLQRYAQDHPDQLGAVAALLESVGQADAAEAMYRRFVARSDRPEAVLALANFLGRQNRVTDALALCDDAWATAAPEAVGNTIVRVLYAARSYNSEPTERVADRLERAVRQHPEKISLLFDLANVRSFQGRYDDAERIYRQLAELDTSASGPLNNLAWLLAVQGQKGAEALELANRAISLAGPDPDLLDTRGLAFLAVGQIDRAIQDLQDAVALSPSADKYVHLAQTLLAARRRAEAREALREAENLKLNVNDLHPLERETYHQLHAELTRR